MTLEEAILRYEEIAEKQENNAKSYPRPNKNVKGSGRKYNARIKCAKEYKQLAEWLRELKMFKDLEAQGYAMYKVSEVNADDTIRSN